MRKKGWEPLFKDVSSFCLNYNIGLPKMDDAYELPGRPRRAAHKVSMHHHYKNEIFTAVIDWMLQKLNNRFGEVNSELLVCMACLSPHNSFTSFDKDKLFRLAEFYPFDFSKKEREILEDQLESYLLDLQTSIKFNGLKGIESLATKLVETKKHDTYQLVYRLIKLVLVLLVSTALVERAFSAMKIGKTRLRNKIGDEWMNDCLVTFIEKEVFKGVDNELIMDIFQHMKPRRC